MKLTIARSTLLAALTPAAAITAPRALSRWGSVVVLRASNQASTGSLIIQSAKDFTFVRSTATADVSKAGDIAVPAEELAKRVALMPDGPLSLSLASNKLTIKSGASVHHLRTMSADDAPAYPTMTAEPVKVDGNTLAALLDATAFAVEEGNPRGARFDGVLFDTREGLIVATSSDGRGRFARATAPHAGGAVDTFVPTMACDVIRAALSPGESVSLAASDRAVAFAFDAEARVELAYTKPDVGVFPYDNLFSSFPANDGTTIKRREFAALVKRVTPDGVSGSVPLSIKCDSGRLVLHNITLGGDESTDEMEIGGAAKWSVIVEAGYLRDALRVGGEDVMLRAGAAKDHPLVVKATLGELTAISMIAQCAARAAAEKKEAA